MTGKNEKLILPEEFGPRLKEFRDFKQLSQKKVAEQLGVAESTYANWEQGRRDPGIADLINLLKVLEIDPRELFWK